MKSTVGYVAWAASVLILLTSPAAGQESDCKECRAVLAGGTFNTTNINKTTSSKKAFESWLCTTDFGTHDEAVGAGISVGVPVYGVPVKIGGTWTESDRQTWKMTHCQSTASASDEFSSLVVAVREASPDILKAWTTCIETTCKPATPRVLACRTTPTKGGTIFEATWHRSVGDTNPPKVAFFRAFDATCTPSIKKDDIIPEGGIALNCKVAPTAEAQFVLQTSRGTCTPAAESQKAVETLSGRVELPSPRHIKADRIVVKDGALFVTNGHRLTLEAVDIVLEGSSRIASFDPMKVTGRSAGPVIIKATRLSGTSMLIDNNGEAGAAGADGAAGAKGAKGGQGTQRDHNFINGCIGGSDGGRGGQGGDGANGSAGATGGNGGTVVLDVGTGLVNGAIERLIISTKGGQGGAGGAGGAAGAGGDGGDAAPGTFHCGGTNPGPPGPSGRPGQPGAKGANGADGVVVNTQG